MNPVIGPLNRLFHLVRRHTVTGGEAGEYSGGYYAARIREAAARELAGVAGVVVDVGCGEGMLLEKLLSGACGGAAPAPPPEGHGPSRPPDVPALFLREREGRGQGRRGLWSVTPAGGGGGTPASMESFLSPGIPARHEPLLVGVDAWAGILERLRERLADRFSTPGAPPLHLVRGDGTRLPLTDGCADGCAAVNLLLNLETWHDVRRTLTECARILAPGGRLVFDLRNRRNLLHLARYKAAKLYDETLRTPLRTYFPGDIERLLADLGLTVERRLGIGFPAATPLAPIFLYVAEKPRGRRPRIPAGGSRTLQTSRLPFRPPFFRDRGKTAGGNGMRGTGSMTPVVLHPPVSFPVSPLDGPRLLARPTPPRARLEARLTRRFGCPAFLVGTGQTALWLILSALAARAPRRARVILPAYTAPSVYVTIRGAGLEPVPVDLDPATWALDPAALEAALDERTLAVVHVHPFGIPVDPAPTAAVAARCGAALIEDNAQGLGGRIAGRFAGTPLGFSSLNRGKNLPTEGGAILFCAEAALMAEIRALAARHLRPPGITKGALLPLFTSAFALAADPRLYGRFQALIGRFKQTAPPGGTDLVAYADAQAKLLDLLLPRLVPANAEKARRVAIYLNALRDLPEVGIPRVGPGVAPAWNRFPVLMPDEAARDRLLAGLAALGVEGSRLYIRSIPEHFGLPEGDFPCPAARRIGRRLVTLPVQPSLPFETAGAVARLVADIL